MPAAVDRAYGTYMKLGYLWRTSRRHLPTEVQEAFLDLLFQCQRRVVPNPGKPVSVSVAEARTEVRQLVQLAKAIATRPLSGRDTSTQPDRPPGSIEKFLIHTPRVQVPSFSTSSPGIYCDECGIWQPFRSFPCPGCVISGENLAQDAISEVSVQADPPQPSEPLLRDPRPHTEEPFQSWQELVSFSAKPVYRQPTPYPSRVPSVESRSEGEGSSGPELSEPPSAIPHSAATPPPIARSVGSGRRDMEEIIGNSGIPRCNRRWLTFAGFERIL